MTTDDVFSIDRYIYETETVIEQTVSADWIDIRPEVEIEDILLGDTDQLAFCPVHVVDPAEMAVKVN